LRKRQEVQAVSRQKIVTGNFDRALAAKIDHTLLKPDAVDSQYLQLCEEAKAYGFATVCVPPSQTANAIDYLGESEVGLATVVGFPLGYALPVAKMFETQSLLALGVNEIDMVINIADLKSKNYDKIEDELSALKAICSDHILKVIIETALLNDEEKIAACRICTKSQVDYVKTSTGFAGGGATLEDVRLMRAELPKEIKIKASGGIKSHKFALALIAAGADRLGCSSSVQVVQL